LFLSESPIAFSGPLVAAFRDEIIIKNKQFLKNQISIVVYFII